MALNQIIKWLAMGGMSLALCGCFGGTVAQQLARSIFMHGADRVTASALEAKEKSDKLEAQKMPLKDTPPDPYKLAFINSAFETITPQVEPLPAVEAADEEKPIQLIQETKLVQVEVWSLLAGDEKNRILEKARLKGSTAIPPKNEWQQWQIAVGAETILSPVKNGNKQSEEITFLVPPEIGKMRSGTKAVVELSSVGELNIARYAAN